MTAPIAQRLRHRVIIEEPTRSPDAEGDLIENWVSVAENIPAEIVPLSGREYIAAQSVQAGVNTRLTIRYRDGITPLMRVLHEDNIYNIRAVLPDPKLRRHLTLMCESGVNTGG